MPTKHAFLVRNEENATFLQAIELWEIIQDQIFYSTYGEGRYIRESLDLGENNLDQGENSLEKPILIFNAFMIVLDFYPLDTETQWEIVGTCNLYLETMNISDICFFVSYLTNKYNSSLNTAWISFNHILTSKRDLKSKEEFLKNELKNLSMSINNFSNSTY